MLLKFDLPFDFAALFFFLVGDSVFVSMPFFYASSFLAFLNGLVVKSKWLSFSSIVLLALSTFGVASLLLLLLGILREDGCCSASWWMVVDVFEGLASVRAVLMYWSHSRWIRLFLTGYEAR